METELRAMGAEGVSIANDGFGGWRVYLHVGSEHRVLTVSAFERHSRFDEFYSLASETVKEMRAVDAVRKRILGASK